MTAGVALAVAAGTFAASRILFPRKVLGIVWGAPLPAPITAGWGDDRSALGTLHYAADIHAPRGTLIRSVMAGTVVRADSVDDTSRGRWVLVRRDTEHGPIHAMSIHLDRVLAKVGQRVGRGTGIGTVGCTGHCSKPHLHLQVMVPRALRDLYESTFGRPSPGFPGDKDGLGYPIPVEALIPNPVTERVARLAQQRSVTVRGRVVA